MFEPFSNKILNNFQRGFSGKEMVSPPDFFLGVILMAATLARRKTAGLGVGFPTALFSGGAEGGIYTKKIFK